MRHQYRNARDAYPTHVHTELIMRSSPEHERFMTIAIEEARLGAAIGEQPFGAVVARNGEVIVKTRSLKVSTFDTTQHCETLAIRHATQRLGRRALPDCGFYCPCEPCPMCGGAILNAGIRTLVM